MKDKLWSGNNCVFVIAIFIQVDELIASVEKIDIEVRSLESCAFNRDTFHEVLGKIQKAVDDLNLHSYSNLSSWVQSLDQEVGIVVYFHIWY